MTLRIVRLGSKRCRGEGTRIGTVRRPPRGVRKADFAKQDWFDTWLPNLSPSEDTMKKGLAAATVSEWNAFEKSYRREMSNRDVLHIIELLAALSHSSNFSVGCYCEDESSCHRSILRQLLIENGAKVA